MIKPPEGWVNGAQKNKKRGPLLAHAGMVGAAGAILKDLDELGILPTLILGKEAGKAAAGEGKGQEVGAAMSTALDTKVSWIGLDAGYDSPGIALRGACPPPVFRKALLWPLWHFQKCSSIFVSLSHCFHGAPPGMPRTPTCPAIF